MYSQSDIEEAVAAGALTADQAASLRNHVAARTGVPTADGEYVRIMLGGSDLYVFYSALILLFGLGWLGSKIHITEGVPSPFSALFVTVAAWGLSEIFARRRRQAMPGIGFAFCFVYGVFFSLLLLAGTTFGPENLRDSTGNIVSAVCALLAAAAAFVHWKRFQEPVTVSLGVAMVCLAVVFLIGAAATGDSEGSITKIVMLILGLATLAYALMWEGKDTGRVTARADVGFWLHVNATWLVVIALFSLLHLENPMPSAGMSILAIVLFFVLALVGLAVDRRNWALGGALLLGIGVYHLMTGDGSSADSTYGADGYGGSYGGGYNPYGGTAGDNVMYTLIIVGAVLVLLGMFWTPLRRTIAGALPAGLQARVPAAAAAAPAAAEPEA